MHPRARTKALIFTVISIFAASSARAQNPTPPHREHVRFSYRAPEGCPTESDFLNLVSARDAEIISDDQAARTLSIALAFEDDKWRASLFTEGIASGQATRTINGDSCEAVARSIAIFTAIALREGSPDELPPAHPSPEATSSIADDKPHFVRPAPPPPPEPQFNLASRRVALAAKQTLSIMADGGRSYGLGMAATYFLSEWIGIDAQGDVLFDMVPYRRNTYYDETRARLETHVEIEMLRASGTIFGARRGNPIDLFAKPGVGLIWTRATPYYIDAHASPSSYYPQCLVDSVIGTRIYLGDSYAVTLEAEGLAYGKANSDADRTITFGLAFQLGLVWFP
jgi:hypothetical protein